jgi:hypothetical protein
MLSGYSLHPSELVFYANATLGDSTAKDSPLITVICRQSGNLLGVRWIAGRVGRLEQVIPKFEVLQIYCVHRVTRSLFSCILDDFSSSAELGSHPGGGCIRIVEQLPE